jgi:Rho-binding antiterminator
MDVYQPLDCDLHDYLEIACMHHYQLRVELIDGSYFDAKALTTRTSAQKEEFFCVQKAEGQQEIRLDKLLAITPLNENASFARIVFADNVGTCSRKK